MPNGENLTITCVKPKFSYGMSRRTKPPTSPGPYVKAEGFKCRRQPDVPSIQFPISTCSSISSVMMRPTSGHPFPDHAR